MDTNKTGYDELAFYTLSKQDDFFIHQLVVDAYTAQNADENSKPIRVIFALAGLYLCVEKKFTGREVQLFHIKMAKNKKDWPEIILPEFRGEINIDQVLAVSPGPERDKIIHKWCASVWKAFGQNHRKIIHLVEQYSIF